MPFRQSAKLLGIFLWVRQEADVCAEHVAPKHLRIRCGPLSQELYFSVGPVRQTVHQQFARRIRPALAAQVIDQVFVDSQGLVQPLLVDQIPRRRGLRQDLQHQLRNRVVKLCRTTRFPVVCLPYIRFGGHHQQIRPDPIHRAVLTGEQLQMFDQLRHEDVVRLGQRTIANPVAGCLEHVQLQAARSGIAVDQHAVLFEFAEVHALGPVVGVGRPVVVVLMGDIVGIIGVEVGQAFQVVPPRREVFQPPGNPCLPRRARHGRIDVPFLHAPVGCLDLFPFSNDCCHGLPLRVPGSHSTPAKDG